jgi:hypothetical protein
MGRNELELGISRNSKAPQMNTDRAKSESNVKAGGGALALVVAAGQFVDDGVYEGLGVAEEH